MKKLIYLLPAALVLSGCTLFPSAPITGTNQQKAEKLSQIISSGGKADCKITNLADNSSTQITISGKKMKFVGSDFGQGNKGTMINDTVNTYIWEEGQKTGIKTKIQTEVSPTPSIAGQPEVTNPTDQVNAYDDASKYKVDCTTRVIQDSEFTPPADVKFTDYSEMLKNVPTVPAIPSLPAKGQ